MIQDLLKNYKMHKAKIKIARMEIEHLQELLKMQLQHDESQDEIIEALSLKSAVGEGGSRTNKISQPTEIVALTYLVQWFADPPGRSEIKQRIADIKSAIYGMELDIQLLDSAITALTDRERYIVGQLYFEGLSWTKIIEDFEHKFEFRDERTLRRYRKEALNKMDQLINAK